MAALRALALSVVLFAVAAPVSGAASPMPTDDQIFNSIAELTSHGPRRPGTAAGEFAVGYVKRQFEQAGLTGVSVEETPTNAWRAKASSLAVGNTAIPAFPVAYSLSPSKDAEGDFSTPDGGLTAPLVDGGLGTPAGLAGKDVKGKIVVFDLKFILPGAVIAADSEFLWDPGNTLALDPLNLAVANPYQSTYATAIGAIQDAGAVGFIGVLGDYFDSNRYYNEYYRSLNVKLPGMWVTKKEGAHIRSLMAADLQAKATVKLATHKRRVMSHAVVGYLEGKSKESILVASHHDSVWQGAVEDGSGAAEVIALAKHYGAMPARTRQRTLMFATFDSHFSGYQAHDAFAYRHVQHRDPARDPYEPVALVEIEHIARQGKQDADGKLVVTGQPEARGVFENLQPALKLALDQAIVKRDLRRTVVLDGEKLQYTGIPTDGNWALLGGLPTASFISGPNYLYDQADTLDKLQKNDLQKVALTFADLIDAMDTTPRAQLGLPPADVKRAAGPASVDAPASDTFGFAPGCSEAASGPVVARVRARAGAVTFAVRRTAPLRLLAAPAGGTLRTVATRRVVACTSYRLTLPAGTAHAALAWPGGRVAVRPSA